MSIESTVLWFVLLASSLLPSVVGHGYVSRVKIDGTNYEAWKINGPSTKSVIRHVTDYFPMFHTDNPGLNCGPGATNPAPLVADATPGGEIRVHWSAIDGANASQICPVYPSLT
jgi:hypothetical protein